MSASRKKIVAVVQARVASSRLPGKVLLPLAGREVLYHIWERLSQVKRVKDIVIATTAAPANQPIVDFGQRRGINVFMYHGSDQDVLGRLIACGQHYEADIMVMVDGDCPLLHPPTIDRMVQALEDHPEAEYSRLDERSIEGGVAVLRLATFEKIAQLAGEPTHREHATLFLLENPHLFTIVEVPCEPDFLDVKHRLWLDTPADYQFLTEVYRRLYRPGKIVDLHAVVRLLLDEPRLRAINAHVTQKDVRENPRQLVVAAEHLTGDQWRTSREIVARLREEYHAGVRLLDRGVPPRELDRWRQQQTPYSSEPPGSGEALLAISGAADSFRPMAPGPDGEPRMAVGLGNPMATRDLASLAAAYAGYQRTPSGYFTSVQRSSQDGSHLEAPPCPLCGSRRHENVWTHKTGIAHGICLECGHVYLTRQLSQAAIDASYKTYQQSYPPAFWMDPANPLFAEAQDLHRIIRDYLPAPPESLLEVGCGYGHFLSLAAPSCFRAGIEPSHNQALFARKHFGLTEVWECFYGHLSSVPPSWPREGFDLVCSFHVLEHLKQPGDLLQFLRLLLRENGAVALAVPNLLTQPRDLMELFYTYQNWHLHAFSPDTFTYLLRREGFQVLGLREEGPDVMHRSNLVAVARPSGSPGPLRVSQSSKDAAYRALTTFHRTLAAHLQNLQAAFAQWRSRDRKVAIYGGGLHTRALLELAEIPTHQVDLIIDDDPAKQGRKLHGIPIVTWDQALTSKVEVIVVSSLGSEAVILDRLEKVPSPRPAIFGIYRDLMKKI